jgi:hypothetical protein
MSRHTAEQRAYHSAACPCATNRIPYQLHCGQEVCAVAAAAHLQQHAEVLQQRLLHAVHRPSLLSCFPAGIVLN